MHYRVYLINGKIAKFYQEIIREYEKRLTRYCKIQLVPVKKGRQAAGKGAGRVYRIVVSPGGQLLSSEELAEKIHHLALSGHSEVAVFIGGQDLTGDEVWALSPMDMDPGLQATVFFEQLYRAYRILHHEPYHK